MTSIAMPRHEAFAAQMTDREAVPARFPILKPEWHGACTSYPVSIPESPVRL